MKQPPETENQRAVKSPDQLLLRGVNHLLGG